jgi:ATP-binding cassette subfamily F protein 3
MLIVSHDRDLLNKAVNGILHLEDGALTQYQGGYDAFERTRRERQAHRKALAVRQEAQRKHIQSFVDRFRYKATKARQAQSRLKMLARMEPIAAVAEDRDFSFDFPRPKQMPPPLIVLDGAEAGYEPGKPVLRKLDLRIDMDDRIALLGANGNGKTTFLRILAGRMEPSAGHVRRPGKLGVGYFSQNQMEELPAGATAFRHMATLLPDLPETKVRGHLGRFGLSQTRGNTRIADLSGGEKARLLLACITREAPQILLLDEPNNHLDVDAREALVQALNAYEGAVVLVSHDAHLIGLVADRLWLVADGTCRPYDGDMEDYRRTLLDQRRAGRRERRNATVKTLSKQQQRRRRAGAREALAAGRKQLKKAEAALNKLNGEKQQIQTRLADPEIYNGAANAVADLTRRAGELDRAIAAAEAAWLAAQEALDGAAG